MQEYKLVIRNLSGGATLFDSQGQVVTQNFSEFASYLNDTYLEQGYEVLKVDLVSKTPSGEGGSPVTYEFAYHLVKEHKAK